MYKHVVDVFRYSCKWSVTLPHNAILGQDHALRAFLGFLLECGAASFRGLHMLIPKIAEFNCIVFFFKSCVRRHAGRPLCNLLFANCSIVFSGRASLTDFRVGCCAAIKRPFVEVCRAISPYCTRKAPCTLPEPWRHSDAGLRNRWARCHCGIAPWVLTFKVATVWCCRRWPMCTELRRICSSGVLYSLTLTGTSSLATLCNRIAVANWPSKSHLLRTWSHSTTLAGRLRGDNEVPRDRTERRELCDCTIVRTENKDPNHLFTTFIRFIFFVSIFQSNTKTR